MKKAWVPYCSLEFGSPGFHVRFLGMRKAWVPYWSSAFGSPESQTCWKCSPNIIISLLVRNYVCTPRGLELEKYKDNQNNRVVISYAVMNPAGTNFPRKGTTIVLPWYLSALYLFIFSSNFMWFTSYFLIPNYFICHTYLAKFWIFWQFNKKDIYKIPLENYPHRPFSVEGI